MQEECEGRVWLKMRAARRRSCEAGEKGGCKKNARENSSAKTVELESCIKAEPPTHSSKGNDVQVVFLSCFTPRIFGKFLVVLVVSTFASKNSDFQRLL